MTIGETSSAYNVFRGIYKAEQKSNPKEKTEFLDIAEKKVQNQGDKTGITVLLEDFTKKFKSFHGENHSNITAKDAENNEVLNYSFDSDNIFASKSGQKLLNKSGKYYQSDIFLEDVNKNGGIKYGYVENLAGSALNFAKADMYAIEKSYNYAYPELGGDYGGLDMLEIDSYIADDYSSKNKDAFEEMMVALDLDGNKIEITPEEYASYILVADTNKDGTISKNEAENIKNTEDSDIKKEAQIVYDKQYKSKARYKYFGLIYM